jgi:hypothetical protein
MSGSYHEQIDIVRTFKALTYTAQHDALCCVCYCVLTVLTGHGGWYHPVSYYSSALTTLLHNPIVSLQFYAAVYSMSQLNTGAAAVYS